MQLFISVGQRAAKTKVLGHWGRCRRSWDQDFARCCAMDEIDDSVVVIGDMVLDRKWNWRIADSDAGWKLV